jgi:hypothetical protein
MLAISIAEPLRLVNDMRVIVIARDQQYELDFSRLPVVGEHVLIDDRTYVVKTVQHIPSSSIAGQIWVAPAPMPTKA